jgi:hypothetical protein
MFNVFLCIPQDYDHNFPPLGTPALCAFLKQKGIDASQTDLNLKYRDLKTGLTISIFNDDKARRAHRY